MRHAVVLFAILLPTGPAREAAAQPAPRRVSLEETLVLFARHGPGLQAVRAEAAGQVGSVRTLAAFPNPTIGVSRESIGDGDRSAGETYITLSQPLRWPWAGSARGRAATDARRAADLRVRADSLELVHGVRQAYVTAWLAEARQEVLARVARVVGQAHDRGAERMAAGDLSGLDQRRLVLERLRYAGLLVAGRQEVEAAHRALAAAVLPPEDRGVIAPADLPDPGARRRQPLPLAGPVIFEHPEVLSARAELRLAEAEGAAERSLAAPPPIVTAAYKDQDDGLTGLLVGAALPLPVFDRRKGPRQVATARVAVAEAQLAQTERRVADQLELARLRYQAAVQQWEQFAAAAGEGGRDLLAIAEIAYHEGELDLLGLLATAEAWRDLGALAAAARAEYWLSRFELERALGGDIPTTVTAGEEAR